MGSRTRPLRAVLIGAGNRGADVYGGFALAHPWLFKFVGAADLDEGRLERFARDHGIPPEGRCAEWKRLLDSSGKEDLVFICTPDREHFAQAMACMERGRSLVLEKPVAVSAAECLALDRTVASGVSRVIVCHVLRYTRFFSTLKRMLDEGRVGTLVSVSLQENVGYYHYAHSYVRGNWRSARGSSPVIVAKSCHDMDILYWLAGAGAESVWSSGNLRWFRPENAPAGAPGRCLDGCPARPECPWYAPNLYLTDNVGWPASVIATDTSMASRLRALEAGPYGRCVYRCDNDVADHQQVAIRFRNGLSASFELTAFSAEIDRVVRAAGTAGEIVGEMRAGWLELRDFKSGSRSRITLDVPVSGHSGGDDALMYDIAASFGASAPGTDDGWDSRSRLEDSLEGHWMAFAAEASRLEGRAVRLDEYRAAVAAGASV